MPFTSLLCGSDQRNRGTASSMAYAYFVVHQPDGLLPLQNQGEQAALFAWSFLLLAFTGPGALALGRALRRQPQLAAT